MIASRFSEPTLLCDSCGERLRLSSEVPRQSDTFCCSSSESAAFNMAAPETSRLSATVGVSAAVFDMACLSDWSAMALQYPLADGAGVRVATPDQKRDQQHEGDAAGMCDIKSPRPFFVIGGR
ncbi:hypothetical protein MRX96_031777 [Rhipicephalus microplus]